MDKTWIIEKEFAENREYGAAEFCCFCFICSSNVLTFVNFLDGFLLRICGGIFEAAIPLVQFFPIFNGNFFYIKSSTTCSTLRFYAVLCKRLAETTEDSQPTLTFGPPLVLEVETAFFLSIHSLNVNPGKGKSVSFVCELVFHFSSSFIGISAGGIFSDSKRPV